MIDEATTMNSDAEVPLNARYQAIHAAPRSIWFWPIGVVQQSIQAEP